MLAPVILLAGNPYLFRDAVKAGVLFRLKIRTNSLLLYLEVYDDVLKGSDSC